MTRILWLIVFFGAYVWVVTSGRQQFVVQQGKAIYNALVAWFDDAEVDYQLKQQKKEKKRARRWD